MMRASLSAGRRRFDNGFAHWAELAAACLLVGGLVGDVGGLNGTTIDPLLWLIAAVVLVPRLLSFIPPMADITVSFLSAIVLGVVLWLQAARLAPDQVLGMGWFMDLLGCGGLVLSVGWRLSLRSRWGTPARVGAVIFITLAVAGAVGATWAAGSHINARCCSRAPSRPGR